MSKEVPRVELIAAALDIAARQLAITQPGQPQEIITKGKL